MSMFSISCVVQSRETNISFLAETANVIWVIHYYEFDWFDNFSFFNYYVWAFWLTPISLENWVTWSNCCFIWFTFVAYIFKSLTKNTFLMFWSQCLLVPTQALCSLLIKTDHGFIHRTKRRTDMLKVMNWVGFN